MKRILFVGLALMTISVYAEIIDGIDYRQARESDVPAVISVLEEIASIATDRVLIPPRRCFKQFVEDMIHKKYLFIAVKKVNDKEVVIATKKLFVAEGADKKDILENLIRAEGPKAKKSSLFRERIKFSPTLDPSGKIKDYSVEKEASSSQAPEMGVYLYDGFEYTRDDHQRIGINWHLTQNAYKTIAPSVNEALQKSPTKKLTLLYVLADRNAGVKPDNPTGEEYIIDRTPGIAKTFHTFIKTHIPHQVDPITLELSRYDSYLRVFNLDSQDCTTPLPDKDHMYGFALTYTLK